MIDDPPQLHHERLDAYQTAIEFLAFSSGLLDRFPRGYGEVADQLKRASLSIPLNIAEGYGKRSQADRGRFYDMCAWQSQGKEESDVRIRTLNLAQEPGG